MWRMEEFADGLGNGWFAHRFRNTVFFDETTKQLFLFHTGHEYNEYEEREEESQSWRLLQWEPSWKEWENRASDENKYYSLQEFFNANKHLIGGVPEHGWVMDGDNNPIYLTRHMWDKWKWGYQPDQDTRNYNNWWCLYNPRHGEMSETDNYVINYDYAVVDRLLYFQEERVGRILATGDALIESEYDFAYYDEALNFRRLLA